MKQDRPMIAFDRPMLERLKQAYKNATTAGADQFTFDGNDYVVGYAKYLIEFLEGELPR